MAGELSSPSTLEMVQRMDGWLRAFRAAAEEMCLGQELPWRWPAPGKEEEEVQRRPWTTAGFNGSLELCAALCLCTYIITPNKTEEAINK